MAEIWVNAIAKRFLVLKKEHGNEQGPNILGIQIDGLFISMEKERANLLQYMKYLIRK